MCACSAYSVASLSIQYYLLKIRTIVDALASIGDPIPFSHHIDVILEGLIVDYAPIGSVVKKKTLEL